MEISSYVCIYLKQYPEDVAFLILRILEIFSCKVCEMFVYKYTDVCIQIYSVYEYTEITEYVKKVAYFLEEKYKLYG